MKLAVSRDGETLLNSPFSISLEQFECITVLALTSQQIKNTAGLVLSFVLF